MYVYVSNMVQTGMYIYERAKQARLSGLGSSMGNSM